MIERRALIDDHQTDIRGLDTIFLIETISLAVLAGLAGNKRAGHDIAVATAFGQNPMQDKIGPGGFITSANRSSLG